MISTDAAWFFVPMAVLILVIISLISTAAVTACLNLLLRKKYFSGVLRNFFVGLITGGFFLLGIVFFVDDLAWLNGEPMNWSTTLWDNSGKVSLVISTAAVALVHLTRANVATE